LPKGFEDAIQGYVNEQGQFVHLTDPDDDSTVVVIINSEDMQENADQSAVAFSDSVPAEVKVTAIPGDSVPDVIPHERVILHTLQQES